jgi:hypothetical protein
MNDVGSRLLDYSLDIVTSPNSFEIPCPRCSQTIEVRVSIRFDLRMQAPNKELTS